MKRNIFLTVVLALTGCNTFKVVAETDVCAPWTAIAPSKTDALTDGTARQILAHNCTGAALKCWPYPKDDPSVCRAD